MGGRAAGLAQMSQAAGKAEGTPIGTWASDEDETDAAGEQMSAALSVALPQDGYVSESLDVFSPEPATRKAQRAHKRPPGSANRKRVF